MYFNVGGNLLISFLQLISFSRGGGEKGFLL